MGPSPDALLGTLAAHQHGVFTLDQARELGFGDKAIRVRRNSGRWIDLHPGVCAVAGSPSTPDRALVAAHLARPGSIVTHASAGRLHRVGLVPGRSPTLSVGPNQRALDGCRVRRRADLTLCRTVEIGALIVTDLATTLFDLAADLRPGRYERILDDVLSAHRVAIDELVVVLDRHGACGRNGTTLARRTIEARAEGMVVTDSVLEQLFRRHVAPRLGQAPVYGYLPPWRIDGVGRVDVAFPEHRLIIELDGRRWHSRDQQWEEDHRRDQLAARHGWRTLRFTYRQIRDDPIGTARIIADVLALSAE